MKNVILLYFICLCTAAAQVPQPGIYRVQKPTPFAYDIQRYGDYVYKDKSIAKSYLNEKSQADYAVVAVDKENRSVTFQILSKTKQPAHPSEHDGQLSIEKAFVGHYQSPQDTLVWNQKYYGEDFQGIQQGNGYFFRVYPQCFHLCGTPKIREDSATERTPDRKPTVYRTIQYAVSPFGLQTARPYKGMLRVYTEKVFFHSKPDKATRTKSYVINGDYVAVLSETDFWMQVEYVSATGKITGGWLNKDELYGYIWLRQKDQTPTLRFEVAFTDTTTVHEDNDYDHVAPIAAAIKIVSKKTGKPVQIIEQLSDTENRYGQSDLTQVFKLIDCNFDGYQDIEIFAHDGGAGPNYGNDYFVYNPKTGRFVYHEQLSNLSQPEIDSKKQEVRGSWRAGAGNHGTETYKFVNGKMDTVYRWERNCLNYIFCDWYEGRRINGKWVETKSRSTFLGGYESPLKTREPVFAQPNDKQAVDTIRNSEIVVRDETADWFRIDYEQQIAYDSATGKSRWENRKGWIRKDIFLADWQPVEQQNSRFHFEAGRRSEAVELGMNEKAWAGLRLTDTQTNRQQVILFDNAVYPKDSTQAFGGLLQTADCNFDGLPDFRIESEFSSRKGQTDARELFVHYLYDPKTGSFEPDSLLNALPNVAFETVAKTITAAWFDKEGDDYLYNKVCYQRTAHGWQLVESRKGRCRSDDCVLTEKKLQNGKWIEKTEKVLMETLLPKKK